VRLRQIGTALAIVACGVVLVSVERAPEQNLSVQPPPDSQEYAYTARALAQDQGDYTYSYGNVRLPSRYAPGYPLALSPFAMLGGEFPRQVQLGAKFWALVYVVVAVFAAWVLGGPLATILASIFIGISPFSREAAGLIMADAFVAALTVMALPLVAIVNRPGARLAGFATGWAAFTRITSLANLVGTLVALPRRGYKSVLLFAAPWLLGLVILQWMVFGSPFETGYSYWDVSAGTFALQWATSSDVDHEGPYIYAGRFDGQLLDWVCPCQVGGPESSLSNIAFYPLTLVGAFWLYSPPFVPLLGLAYAWRRRGSPVGRYALVVTALSLGIFVFYEFQAARFLAGPATILVVLAAVWCSEMIEHLYASGFLRRAVRG
jgi:hypothetical protein